MLKRCFHLMRAQSVFLVVIALGIAAGGVVTFLVDHADASRRAQSQVGSVKFALVDLENAPFSVARPVPGSADRAQARIASDESSIRASLAGMIAAGSAPAALQRVQAEVDRVGSIVQEVFRIAKYHGLHGSDGTVVGRDNERLQVSVAAIQSLLTPAGRIYSLRAATAKTQAVIGSLATITLLLSAFALFYRRARLAQNDAERLLVENARLLMTSMDEAITDPLTNLGNRRAFKRDLEQLLPRLNADDELMVSMFDLDGFKVYNDTFGHGAGDALLARLAGRMKETVKGAATAYRMGGDEFCVLAPISIADGEQLVSSAVAALSDNGQGWQIGCSWGVSWMPSEATGAGDALRLADERMYAQKAGRATVGAQAAAALVQVLVERDVELSTHISLVTELATATAQRLGLPEHEITRLGLAAQLHDIGKTAIPESILNKPSSLDEQEWSFMRRHTLIGERIVAAAPSLAHTASVVRSSHERLDGNGYPDGLAGNAIPIGSRIIAVCDAYDAMISPRAYRPPRSISEAIDELRVCAGSQFDPEVVDAFITLAAERKPVAGLTSSANAPA
jgi:two-component system cell cycle response regulator